jgi:hypothetical protein
MLIVGRLEEKNNEVRIGEDVVEFEYVGVREEGLQFDAGGELFELYRAN